MRLLVVYELSGDIAAVITQPDGAPLLSVDLEPGQTSGIVDVPEIGSDAGSETLMVQLQEFRQRYRIASDPSQIRLVARETAD
ncbi:hypothetical protein [Streptomyces sp. NPDC051183]|uniref:hypothetical protein n=1 Tax=Streptomyces sp. NPDC051183 TaxID=3155165 RepID=UPI00343A1C9F